MTDFTTWERESLISFCQSAMKKVAELRAELALAKTYMPGQKAQTLPHPAHGDFSKQYWWNETDEEFAASGKPYIEVTE